MTNKPNLKILVPPCEPFTTPVQSLYNPRVNPLQRRTVKKLVALVSLGFQHYHQFLLYKIL